MTDAELAILSLVAEGPQHGYQIQQAIEARGVRDWAAIGFSSVYYLLNKLENEGLLESKLTPSERGPARKVYALTKGGRGVLQTAIADLLSTPHECGSGFLLALANLHLLRPEQVRHALDTYESKLRARIADLNARRAEIALRQPEPPLSALALVDYTMRLALAEVDWLQEFRQAWEAQAPSTLPAPDPFRAPVIVDKTPTLPPHGTQQLPRPESEEESGDGAG